MARPRKKKSRRRPRKAKRCVRKVKRQRTEETVCRASNPRQFSLYAQARGTPVLKYVGGIKFAKVGRPVRFDSRAHAAQVGRQLKAQFRVLRKFKLWAA